MTAIEKLAQEIAKNVYAAIHELDPGVGYFTDLITRHIAAALKERDEKVGEILRWLYGLAPEGFAPRRPDAGAYWSRTEMSQRLEAAGMGDLLAPNEGGSDE